MCTLNSAARRLIINNTLPTWYASNKFNKSTASVQRTNWTKQNKTVSSGLKNKLSSIHRYLGTNTLHSHSHTLPVLAVHIPYYCICMYEHRAPHLLSSSIDRYCCESWLCTIHNRHKLYLFEERKIPLTIILPT